MAEPARFEGNEIVMTHTIRGYNLTDPIQIAFEQDERILHLPLRFPDEPGLFVGGVISLRGTSRLLSEGYILVTEYHVAGRGSKLMLGIFGFVFLVAFLIVRYRFVWSNLVLERRSLD